MADKIAHSGASPNQTTPWPIQKTIYERLSNGRKLTVAFPACSGDMLSLIDSTKADDDIARLFTEYFAFVRHRTLGNEFVGTDGSRKLQDLDPVLDGGLNRCATEDGKAPLVWPSDCCICRPCVTLQGTRDNPDPKTLPAKITRLFIGDAVWLFYFDRMGIHQILGALLDAYAYTGTLPISNGALDAGVKDDMVALVLEIMVREVKAGQSSGVRDRTAMERLALGWTTEYGRKLSVNSQVNQSFNSLFHKFLYLALEYYRDRRLADAIQGVNFDAPGGRISEATVTALRETMVLLKKRFEPFYYGRNYNNTLSGIVWTIAGLSVLRELANTIGIPNTMRDLDEIVPAAYDLLVLKRPITSGETNRYIVHRDCGRYGRDILLDMEVLNLDLADDNASFKDWIDLIESKVEGYRSAYRAMTGIDLGQKGGMPTIEQQA